MENTSEVYLAPSEIPIRFNDNFVDYIFQKVNGKEVNKGDLIEIAVLDNKLLFDVVGVIPKGTVKINDSTKLILFERALKLDKDGSFKMPHILRDSIDLNSKVDLNISKTEIVLRFPRKKTE
jgi:hypothetical protein